MTAIAVHVLNQDVRTVRLERHAIVAVVNHTILNHDVRAAVCIPTISVLRRIVTRTVSTNVEILKDDVGAVGEEVVPLRRVSQVEVGNGSAVQTDGAEEDRSENVDVFGVEVVPDLTISVEHTAAIDVNILAADLEEGRGVLEGLEEAVFLPVVGVIGELDVALNVYGRISQ